MAITEKQNLGPYSAAGNSAPRMVKRKLAASQGIYMAGCPFQMNNSGLLKRTATSDGTEDQIQYIAAAGVAAEQAASTEIYVYVVSINDLWQAHADTSGTDVAATQALIGNEYGITVSTTAGQIGFVSVDVANANAVLHVEDIWPNVCPSDRNFGSTSDTPGILIFRFLQAAIDGEVAA